MTNKTDLGGLIGLAILLALILILAWTLHAQDIKVEEAYTVWKIPQVEKIKICIPDTILWVIPTWDDCKIVDVQRLIDIVVLIGKEVPKTTTTTTYLPMPVPTHAE